MIVHKRMCTGTSSTPHQTLPSITGFVRHVPATDQGISLSESASTSWYTIRTFEPEGWKGFRMNLGCTECSTTSSDSR